MTPRSFRTRLFFLLLLVLVPAGLLVFSANVNRQQTEKESTREQAACAANLAAASQAYYVKQTRQLLATMTQFPFLVQMQDPGLSRTGMANLKLLSPDFSDFGLIERDGSVFCHTLGGNVTGEVIAPAFISRVFEKPEFSVGELHLDPVQKKPSLQFVYPIFDSNKKLARLMYATLKIPLLSAALEEISLPQGGIVSVLDEAGNILAQRPDSDDWVGKTVASTPFMPKALPKKNGVFEANGLDGVKRVYAVSTVTDGKRPVMFIQVAIPQKLLFAQADARFGGSLVGMMVIAILVLSLARWYSRRAFLLPVGAMLEATKRLTEGELTARTGISNGKSELHVLAQRFDVMAETLVQRQNQLEQAHAEVIEGNAELEKRVQERTRDLQTLNSELEAFSYSVSHDLRAPLRHMDGFAQLLARDQSLESNSKALRYLDLITKAAKQMGTLIDDLLSFSKMARQTMAMGTVDSAQIVRSVIDDLKTEEPSREIHWEIGSLPPVHGDAAMFRQVWQNLISNAVKYTRGRESTRIEISSYTEKNEIVFMVADNGAGFDMKYADKLFGVFQRLHREEEFEGTGIGLANVRRIIHRHRGRTWAEGETGKGAKFYFSIPMQAK